MGGGGAAREGKGGKASRAIVGHPGRKAGPKKKLASRKNFLAKGRAILYGPYMAPLPTKENAPQPNDGTADLVVAEELPTESAAEWPQEARELLWK